MAHVSRAIFVCASSLLMAAPLFAATNPAPTKYSPPPVINPFSPDDCETLACRPAGKTYTVKTSEGTDSPVTIPRSPYVTRDGTVVIFPGELLVVDFPNAGDVPGLPKFASADGNAVAGANSLILSYELQAVGKDQTTVLRMRQNSGKTVKLDAVIASFSSDGLKVAYTTTCPLKSDTNSGEKWDGPHFAILLRNFRYLAADAVLDCEAAEGQ